MSRMSRTWSSSTVTSLPHRCALKPLLHISQPICARFVARCVRHALNMAHSMWAVNHFAQPPVLL